MTSLTKRRRSRARLSRRQRPDSDSLSPKSMEPAQYYWEFGWGPWTPPALEDLLPDLSLEERVRLQNQLREHERCQKRAYENSPPRPDQKAEERRDFLIIHHARFALDHYNAKHPAEEFDLVKPLMVASTHFRCQAWYHINFWARCRKSKKIKRFFAEVRYKDLPGSSYVILNLPFPAPCSGSCGYFDMPVRVPIIETCTIIEEPLDRHRKSCAFCSGRLDILHPKGCKFVCGNDKDRMVQRLSTGKSETPKMPFTATWGTCFV